MSILFYIQMWATCLRMLCSLCSLVFFPPLPPLSQAKGVMFCTTVYWVFPPLSGFFSFYPFVLFRINTFFFFSPFAAELLACFGARCFSVALSCLPRFFVSFPSVLIFLPYPLTYVFWSFLCPSYFGPLFSFHSLPKILFNFWRCSLRGRGPP